MSQDSIAPADGAADARGVLRGLLGAFRWRVAREWLADGVAVLTCVLLGVLLSLVVVDHVVPGGVPHVGLVPGLIAAAALAAGTAIWLAFARRASRISDLFAAWRIERDGGVRHNSIINGVLLARDTVEPEGASGAAIRQAARDARVAGAIRPPVRRAARRAAIAGAVLLGLFAGYSLLSPKSAPQSLGRLLGSGAAVPTATRLTLERPARDAVVYESEPLAVEVSAAGVLPDEIEFAWHGSNGVVPASDGPADDGAGARWLRRRMQPIDGAGGSSRWRVTLAASEVVGDIHYAAAGGDATLQGVIRVQPQPAILAFEVALSPPAYTGLPRAVSSSPEITAWAGTLATIAIRGRTALRDPVFVFGDHEVARTWMRIDAADVTRAVVEVPLLESGLYRIEFSDAYGRRPRAAERHSITVRHDEPPTVEWITPAEDASVGATVDLAVIAELVVHVADDLGVGEADFVLSSDDGGTWRLPLVIAPERRSHDADAAGEEHPERCVGEVRVATERIPLAAGQRAAGWVEARDRRVLPDGRPSPQTGRSTALTLTRSAPTGEPTSRPGDGASEADEPAGGGESPQSDPQSGQAGAADATRGADEVDRANGDRGDNVDSGGDSQHERPGPGAGGQSGRGQAEQGQGERPERGGAGGADDWEKFVSQNAEQIRKLAQQPNSDASDAGGQLNSTDDSKVAVGDTNSQDGDSQPGEPREGEPADSPSQAPRGESNSGGESGQQETPGEQADSRQPSDKSGQSGAGRPADRGAGSPQESGETPPRSDASGEGDSGGGGGAGERLPSTPAGPAPSGETAVGDPPSKEPRADGNVESDAPPPVGDGPIDSAGRAERTDLLELLKRRGVLDEGTFQDLTRSPERREAFTRAVERLHAQRGVERSGAVARSSHAYRPGDERAAAGTRRATDLTLERLRPRGEVDDATTIAPPAEQNVAPRLRPLLDAYYRAMAESRRPRRARRRTSPSSGARPGRTPR
ncbi:MAG: hypothetical protein CHACPFDD_00130 [Phycisphaerae bacterium]|nr:hypothetical protein [Phycisphaerae bacterium]